MRATTKDLEEPKRVGRYLRGRPVGAIVFEPQTLPGFLDMFCDVDHAGQLGTRKSRAGMAVMWEVTFDQAWERGAVASLNSTRFFRSSVYVTESKQC